MGKKYEHEKNIPKYANKLVWLQIPEIEIIF